MSSVYSSFSNRFADTFPIEPVKLPQDPLQFRDNKIVKSMLETAYQDYGYECDDLSKERIDFKDFKNDFLDAIYKLHQKKLIRNKKLLEVIKATDENPLPLYHTIVKAAKDHHSTDDHALEINSYRFVVQQAMGGVPPHFIIVLKGQEDDSFSFGKHLKWYSRKTIDLASEESEGLSFSLEKQPAAENSPEIPTIIKRTWKKLDQQILWAQKDENYVIALPEWVRIDGVASNSFELSYCIRNIIGDFSQIYEEKYRFSLAQILNTLNSLMNVVIHIHQQEKVHLGIIPENLFLYPRNPALYAVDPKSYLEKILDPWMFKLDGFGTLAFFGEKVFADECQYPFPEKFQDPNSRKIIIIADPAQDSYCLGWTILSFFLGLSKSTMQNYLGLKKMLFERIDNNNLENQILCSYSLVKHRKRINKDEEIESNIMMGLLNIAYQLLYIDPKKRLSVAEAQSKIQLLLDAIGVKSVLSKPQQTDHLSEIRKLHKPLEYLWVSFEKMALRFARVHVNPSSNLEQNYINVLLEKRLIFHESLMTTLINNGIISQKELQIAACWNVVKGQIAYYKSSRRWNSTRTASTVERKSCAIIPVYHPTNLGRRQPHLIITGDVLEKSVLGKISQAVNVTKGEHLFKITVSQKVEGVLERIITQRELSVNNSRILSPKILPFTILTKENVQKVVYYTECFSAMTTIYENHIGIEKVLESCKEFLKGLSDMHDMGWVHMNMGPHALVWDSNGNLKIHYFNGLTRVGQKNQYRSLNFLPPEAFEEIQRKDGYTATIACDAYASGLTILFFLLSLNNDFTYDNYEKLNKRFVKAMTTKDWDTINQWFKKIYAEWKSETTSEKNMKVELLRIAYHLMNFSSEKRMKCKEALIELERLQAGMKNKFKNWEWHLELE